MLPVMPNSDLCPSASRPRDGTLCSGKRTASQWLVGLCTQGFAASLQCVAAVTSYPILSNIISYPIISYHIISYHIVSYRIISYHIIPYHIDINAMHCTLCDPTVSYPTVHISYPTISYPTVSYPTVSYPTVSYPTVSYLAHPYLKGVHYTHSMLGHTGDLHLESLESLESRSRPHFAC